MKEDRISALPDCLIHHILSFLPSTEEAIRTGILSKRWKNQWTRVPILIFNSGMFPDFSVEDFARFIDSALIQHDCSRIKKLYLAYNFEKDVNFSSKIDFATRNHVEELILCCYSPNPYDPYHLPKLLSHNASLIKLELMYCSVNCDWIINWGSLKAFRIRGCITGKLVANVLSGSPSLEFLELDPLRRGDYERGDYVIASNSLKTLVLSNVNTYSEYKIRISCPNLEELFFAESPMLPDKMISNVVSHCPLLRVLELNLCCFDKLVIASKSLKTLILRKNTVSSAIEISCPNLEEFNFCGSTNDTFKLLSIPSIISATLDLEIPPNTWPFKARSEVGEYVFKQILDQLQNVKELTIGSLFIKILSDLEIRGLYYSWSNNKILTLDGPNFEHYTGIICALHSSPMLERLVIKLQDYEDRTTADLSDLLDLTDPQENYWNSNRMVSGSLVSHLRTIKIVGLSKRDAKCNIVLDFIKFLLKNARALEKLVIMISEDEGESFALAVSKKVSSFPRCSPHAIVELLRSEFLEM